MLFHAERKNAISETKLAESLHPEFRMVVTALFLIHYYYLYTHFYYTQVIWYFHPSLSQGGISTKIPALH